MSAEFIEFPKISRLSREIVVTEKIDGTNAQVFVSDDGKVMAGSRNRWLTTEKDNFGFARWVADNSDELLALGPGRHFGEWWGNGIQRNYGMKEKVFSLFRTDKWADDSVRPPCCRVVPVLFIGPMDTSSIGAALSNLATTGSVAAPGFMDPEGVVIFHSASGVLFKKTIKKDEQHKGDSK